MGVGIGGSVQKPLKLFQGSASCRRGDFGPPLTKVEICFVRRLEMLEDSLLFPNSIKPARFRNVLTSSALVDTGIMSFSQLPEELVDSVADYLENSARRSV